MAPDTEPTDEELAVVMREARDLALQRKAISDEWMQKQVAEAVSSPKITVVHFWAPWCPHCYSELKKNTANQNN